MSRTFATSFVLTAAVIVPAAWHFIDADIQADGKKLRPLQQTLVVDGVRVTLDVDHSLVTTGDKVTAKLRAFSDTPKTIAIDLTLVQSNNYKGERVQQPEIPIDHEKLVLHATPDGGPVVATQLVLGTKPAALAQTDSFKVFIAKHGVEAPFADAFEGARPFRDYDKPVADHVAAAVAIRGWSGNSFAMHVVAEGPITNAKPFTVAIHMKNISGAKLPHQPWPQLGTELVDGSVSAGDDYDITEVLAPDETAADGYRDDKPFKRGQEIVRRYTVTPKGTHDKVTFIAEATAWDEAPGPVIGGAMDVVTFPIVEPTNTVAKR